MKKLIFVGILIISLIAGSVFVFAETSNTQIITGGRFTGFGRNQIRENNGRTSLTSEERAENLEERTEQFKEIMKENREAVKKALKNGEITQQEADEWEEHFKSLEEQFNQMIKYHEENAEFYENHERLDGMRGLRMGFGRMRGRGFRTGNPANCPMNNIDASPIGTGI